jgi:hypothetical protein
MFEVKDLLGFGMIHNSGITAKHLREAIEWSATRGVLDVTGMDREADDDLKGLFVRAGCNSSKFNHVSSTVESTGECGGLGCMDGTYSSGIIYKTSHYCMSMDY